MIKPKKQKILIRLLPEKIINFLLRLIFAPIVYAAAKNESSSKWHATLKSFNRMIYATANTYTQLYRQCVENLHLN
jgi:hypothetical protein